MNLNPLGCNVLINVLPLVKTFPLFFFFFFLSIENLNTRCNFRFSLSLNLYQKALLYTLQVMVGNFREASVSPQVLLAQLCGRGRRLYITFFNTRSLFLCKSRICGLILLLCWCQFDIHECECKVSTQICFGKADQILLQLLCWDHIGFHAICQKATL